MEPFLYNGVNLTIGKRKTEIWQPGKFGKRKTVGKTEYFMGRLYIMEIGFATIFALSFKKFSRKVIDTSNFVYIHSYLLISLEQSLQ